MEALVGALSPQGHYVVVLLVTSAVSCVLSPSGNRQGEREGRWRVPRSGKQEAGAVTQSSLDWAAAVWGDERVCLLGQGGLALGSL